MFEQGTRVFLLLGLCAGAFLACFSAGNDDNECKLGTERCGCDMGACDSGLQCLSDTCVAPGSPAGSGSTGSGSGGDTGSGSTGSGSGGSTTGAGGDDSGSGGSTTGSGGTDGSGGSGGSGNSGGTDSSGGSAGSNGSGGSGGTAPTGTNLITNGSFTNGATDWAIVNGGTPMYSTDTGAMCASLAAYGYVTIGWPDDPAKAFAMESGTTYTFSYTASASAGVSVVSKVGDALTNESFFETEPFTLDTSMQPYSHQVPGVASEQAGIVFIVTSTNSAPTEICVDNVVVEAI